MILSLENVSFVYEGGIAALSGASFSAETGETVCVAGANGAGKSTLLEVIAFPGKASGGTIKTGGSTGIVFQDCDNQLFMPAVWEDVAFGVLRNGAGPAEAKQAALAALRELDAEHIAERPPHRLSGGEKQRAALASVLIMRPDILLLDEPTSSLDPRARKKTIGIIKKLACAKIVASHDLDMMLEIADRVVFLDHGKITAICPAPGLLRDGDFLRSIGLELPLSFR